MAMVGELAAGMAHEIRNPLASLSGAMQMLRKELNLEGENGRLMEIALRETERLNIKITEFLAYARPSPPRKKPCDLNGLLHDTLDLLKNSEEYREGITLWTETDGALWVDVDANQISQVFWNLAINALQAMPGMGELRVSSRSYRILGEEVEIIFFDSGQGIEPDLLDKIFVPFFTTKERGSGLGLSIVHRIVEDHGGRIRVRSRPGDGTEFRVCLPVTSEG
jgi:two-component system sensor histidine kinase PilS (NtrC family)